MQTPLTLRQLILNDIRGTLLNTEDKYVLSEEGINFLVFILNQLKTKGLNQAVVVSEDDFVAYVKSIQDSKPIEPKHLQILPVIGSRGLPRQRESIHYPAVHIMLRPGQPSIGILADHYIGYKSAVIPRLDELKDIHWAILGPTDDCAHFQTDRTHCLVFAIEFLRYMNKLSEEEIDALFSTSTPDSSEILKLRWQDLPVKFMRDYQSLSSLKKYKLDSTSSWQRASTLLQKKFNEREAKWTRQITTPDRVLNVNARISDHTVVRMADQMSEALEKFDDDSAHELTSICYSTRPMLQKILLDLPSSSHPLFAYCFDNIPKVDLHFSKFTTCRFFYSSNDPYLMALQWLIPVDTIFKMNEKMLAQLISQKERYSQLLQLPALEKLNISVMSLLQLAPTKAGLQLDILKANLQVLSEQDIELLSTSKIVNNNILHTLVKRKYVSAAEVLKACIYVAPDKEDIDQNREIERYARGYSKRPGNFSALAQALQEQDDLPPAQSAEKEEVLEHSSSDEETKFQLLW